MSATAERSIAKTAPALHVKALTGSDRPGVFEAVWSLYGNRDGAGDIVEPGAFLNSWARKLPKVAFSHDWMAVPIGVTLEVDDVDRATLERLIPGGVPADVVGGAWSKARLLVDEEAGEDHEQARKVYAAIRGRGGDGRPALDEFSWGGRVLSETVEIDPDGTSVLHIREVDQAEWGPCLRGANPATALVAVKGLIDAGQLTRQQVTRALDAPTDTNDFGSRLAAVTALLGG